MALNTPIVNTVTAFDATTDKKFTFTVVGGDQVVGNTITIIDNTSGTVVYTNTIESYTYYQTVEANTLSNGGYYGVYFQTINSNGDVSSLSNTVTFRCYTTPTLTFINIPSTAVIEAASYAFDCKYAQSESEEINYLYFYLYDEDKDLISQSDIYTSEDAVENVFTHTFNGLVDNDYYYVRAVGETVNGTIVDSNYQNFQVNYEYDGSFMMLFTENYPNEGYISVESNAAEVDGIMYDSDGNKIDPIMDNSRIYIEDGDTLVYNEGFQFGNTQFTKLKWWRPVQLGETLVASDGDDTSITVELKRGVPSNDGYYAKDYLLVSGFENGTQYMQKLSDVVEPLNNRSQIKTIVNINSGVPIVKLETYLGGNYAIWDGDSTLGFLINEQTWAGEEADPSNYFDVDTGASNVEFDKLTDLFFLDEAQYVTLEDEDIVGTPSTSTLMSNVTLSNSIVDKLYITRDNITEFQDDLPEWDNKSVMSADYNDSTAAGNVDWMILSGVDNIKVKRRLSGTFDYVTIFQQDVESSLDLSFAFKDYTVPSGYTFEYAIVPCVGNNENSYYTSVIETCFRGVFVSDKDTTMKLYGNCLISSAQDNQAIGIVQPYNSRYPVIIRNTTINYRTITVQGDILGLKNDEYTFTMNRHEIVEQKLEWEKFLTNGKPKVIKDWNGNIIIGGITTAPMFSYSQASQMGIPTISFGVTEQGQYDNQTDLYNNGFTDVAG